MNFDIQKAINFPFSDKQWVKKTGLYALGIFVVVTIPQIVQFFFSILGYTQLLSSPDYASSTAYSMNSLVQSFTQMGFNIITLPIAWYLSGYLFKTLKNITNKSEDIFPQHGSFWENFKLGFRKLVVQSGPSIVLMILFTPIIALIIVFASDMIIAEGIRIFLYVALAGLIILTVLYMFALPLLTYSMTYIFVKTDSIKKAYSITNITEVIKYAWKEFYLLVGVQIVLGFIIGFLSLFTICISWIATPILSAYTNLVSTYFIGSIYSEIDKGVTIV